MKRTLFESELAAIRDRIAVLGAQVVQATGRAVRALVERDLDEARMVKRDDRASDQLRYGIETACLSTMATQQPVARDLRELFASTFVAVELERCGDYAKGVAKAARRIIRAAPGEDADLEPLKAMDACARNMLERSIAAFASRDVAAARAIISEDERLDALYQKLLLSATHDMSSKPGLIECGTWLMHAGHCLERIGDRATNIAERVIFIETGELTGDLHPHERSAAPALT